MGRDNVDDGRVAPGGGHGARDGARIGNRAYHLTQNHLDTIQELERLFPELAPILHFSDVEPGAESLEIASQRLFGAIQRQMQKPLFLAFCRVNAERIGDYIEHALDDGAWPFDTQELLADTYARLYQHYCGREPGRWPAYASGPFARPIGPEYSTYRMLMEASTQVLQDRILEFRSACLPLPGVPQPESAPPEASVDLAREIVEEARWTLTDDELCGWVSYAYLRLPDGQRKVLYWREHLGHSIQDIAARTQMKPFEVGLEIQRAHECLREEILRILHAFVGEEDPDQVGLDDKASEEEDDHDLD